MVHFRTFSKWSCVVLIELNNHSILSMDSLEQMPLSRNSGLQDQEHTLDPHQILSPSVLNPLDQTDAVAEKMLRIELELSSQLSMLKFSKPVEYVYSPLEYAFDLHAMFVRKFCNSAKDVLFLGMNPGPWGMSQTGVPFGEVSIVKDWFGIHGSVRKPQKEHPARVVSGLHCHRSEVSGKRFWGLFQEICKSDPHLFFKHCFIYNHCPIALMSHSGKNITPAELKASESKETLALCDKALFQVLHLLNIKTVVGIGKFPEKRAQLVCRETSLKDVKVVYIPHPSPRNAACAGKWKESVADLLKSLGLMANFVS